MPIVQMPDGKRVRFPDEMPKDEIKGIIANKYPDAFPKQPTAGETAIDAAKGFGSGVVKGTRELAELPADMQSGAQWLANRAGQKAGVGDVPLPKSILQSIPGVGGAMYASTALQNYLKGDSEIAQGARQAEGYEPQTGVGSVAKKVGQFAPGAVGGGGAMANAVRFGKYALAPGIGAAGGEALAKGTDFEGVAEGIGGLAGLGAGSLLNKGAETFARMGMKTQDDFYKAGTDAFEEAKQANVLIRNSSIQRLKKDLSQHLDDINFLPGVETRASKILDDVYQNLDGTKSQVFKGRGAQTGFGQKPLNLSELDKVGSRIMAKIKELPYDAKGDRRVLWAAKHYIDDFTKSLTVKDILAGDYNKGLKALTAAKQFWKQKSKLELMDQMEESAKHTGNSIYTRAGVEHADRREALKFLRKDKNKRQSLTKDELDALQKVSDQDWLTNKARSLGKMVDSPYSAATTVAIPAGLLGLNVASGGTAAILAGVGAGVGYGARALHKLRVEKSKNDVRSLIINGRKLDRPWNTVLGKLNTYNAIRNQENN